MVKYQQLLIEDNFQPSSLRESFSNEGWFIITTHTRPIITTAGYYSLEAAQILDQDKIKMALIIRSALYVKEQSASRSDLYSAQSALAGHIGNVLA